MEDARYDPAAQEFGANGYLTEAYDIAQVGTYNVKYKTDRLQIGTEEPKVWQKRFLKRPRRASVTVKSNAAIFTLLEGRQTKTG